MRVAAPTSCAPRERSPRRWRDATSLVAAALLLSTGWWLSRPRVGAHAGMAAPDLSLSVVANGSGTIRLTSPEQDAGVRVVEFFASWCRECRHTVPELERRASSAGAQWVAVSVDASPAAAAAAARQWGLSEPVAHDPQRVAADAYGITVLPTTLVIDATGTVAAAHAGAIPGDVLAREIFQACTAQPDRADSTCVSGDAPSFSAPPAPNRAQAARR